MASDTRLFWLFVTLIIAWLLYLLSPIVAPFIAAAFLAYLADPLVNRLERKSLQRVPAVTIVFTACITLFLILSSILIPLIEDQVSMLLSNIPGYIEWLRETAAPRFRDYFDIEGRLIELDNVQKILSENWQTAGGILSTMIGHVSRSGFAFATSLATFLLIPVLTFYLLRDWDSMIDSIDSLLPLRQRPTIRKLARESDEMLSAFLRGQMLVMLALGVIYSLGLWLIGLDFSLLIGMFSGLLSFVPYLGLMLGMLIAFISAILQFEGFEMLPFVALVFILAQALEGMVLTPKLLGDRIGLHPVAVIFAVMAGGSLYGFYGILLGLPVSAVLLVVVRHGVGLYRKSVFYRGDEG